MTTTPKFDIHQEITNRIVGAIESAGDFQLPWVRSRGGSVARPANIASGNPYNGVNILSLWVSAMASDYASNLWGTYRQWQARGAQVKRGEKSSLVVFYKQVTYRDDDGGDDGDHDRAAHERLIAKASHVFNAAQIEGFIPTQDVVLPTAPVFDPIMAAEEFARATGAKIKEEGERACFIPSLDEIHMPDRGRFTGTETISAAESFYATLCHELVHWSGAKTRLDRNLSGRFGSESYAMEELVAELGAAFLCSDLKITPETRADHAQYIANWLRVLKSDKKAIFTAASKASEAAKWLTERRA